jgi:protein TonB
MRIPVFDDIIFERRNKEYGAYFLRKRYNRVVTIAVISAVLLGSITVLIPYLLRPDQKDKEIYTARYVSMENLMAPPGKPGPLLPPLTYVPAPAKASARPKTTETRYVAPMVVDSVPLIEKPIPLMSDSLNRPVEGQGDVTGTGDEPGNYSGVEGGTEGGGGGGGNGLYSVVEIMPKFKGGDIDKFREWVRKKTRYPETATINGIQGRVYITFIVENDGSVSNVKVAKGVDPLIDNEAVKAVASSPKWSPGRLRGVPVRVAYIIMLNFQL